MSKVYVPARSPEDWKALLAKPEEHWRTGFSARAIAHSWQSAAGLPPEIIALFEGSAFDSLHAVRPLLVIPEHQVSLPPTAGHSSQNDVFVLAKTADGALFTITVEGKVSESFDKTVAEWSATLTKGKRERLDFLRRKLGLHAAIPPHVRYQLLHRTGSAVIEAETYCAPRAAMIVHSFSQSDEWFEDFANFLQLFGAEAAVGRLVCLGTVSGIELFAGWARGDPRFLSA